MIPTQLYIEPNQGKRIMTAFRKRKGCRVNVRKDGASRGNFHPGEMLLTPSQWMNYQAAANGKKIIALPFQHEHLVKNMKHKGGFLPLIAAELAPIIGGIAGGLIEREIADSGIYKKKNTSPKKKKMKSGQGSGMHLNPYYKKSGGSGMHLNPYYKKSGGSGMHLNPYYKNSGGSGMYLTT